MVRSCVVCGKVDKLNPNNLSFHRLPNDPEKRKIWLSLVGITDRESLPKTPWLCSDHFYPKDIETKPNGTRLIKKGANPRRCEGVLFLDDLSSSLIAQPKHDNLLPSELVPIPQLTDAATNVSDEPILKIEIDDTKISLLEPKIENDLLANNFDIDENLLATIKEEPPCRSSPDNENDEESERQSIQMFFDSMARTVMTLPPSFVSRIKMEVLRVVSDMEMEAYKEKTLPQNPLRNTENNIVENTDIQQKIKIEDDIDQEVEEILEKDDKLDDVETEELNTEPQSKKRKKDFESIIERLSPNTRHTPVHMFFLSIAHTVTSFPPPFMIKAKVAVLKMISKIEVDVYRSRQSCQDGGGGVTMIVQRAPFVS